MAGDRTLITPLRAIVTLRGGNAERALSIKRVETSFADQGLPLEATRSPLQPLYLFHTTSCDCPELGGLVLYGSIVRAKKALSDVGQLLARTNARGALRPKIVRIGNLVCWYAPTGRTGRKINAALSTLAGRAHG
jgi:hypothetical protein